MDYDVKVVEEFDADVRRLDDAQFWQLYTLFAGLAPAGVTAMEEALLTRWLRLSYWERANVLYRLELDVAEIAAQATRGYVSAARRDDAGGTA